MLINVVAREQKLSEERTQFARSHRRRSYPTQLHNDLIAVIEVIELLRIITNIYFCAPGSLTFQGWHLIQNRLQERCLSRPVWTNDSETFSAPQCESNLTGQRLVRITHYQ